jgi:hypothetical protein
MRLVYQTQLSQRKCTSDATAKWVRNHHASYSIIGVISQQSLFHYVHQLIFNQGEIVILFNYEFSRFSNLNAAPFVNS